MPSLNKAQLIGRLTRDPELRYTPSGAGVCNFAIATNSYRVVDGEKKEITDFHNIVAWNQGKRTLAELCGSSLHKGNLVYIEGRLQTRSWEGQDGKKNYKTEINATDVQFLTPKNGEQRVPVGVASESSEASASSGDEVDEFSIPF